GHPWPAFTQSPHRPPPARVSALWGRKSNALFVGATSVANASPPRGFRASRLTSLLQRKEVARWRTPRHRPARSATSTRRGSRTKPQPTNREAASCRGIAERAPWMAHVPDSGHGWPDGGAETIPRQGGASCRSREPSFRFRFRFCFCFCFCLALPVAVAVAVAPDR